MKNKYIPIQALEDGDGHWYLIPNELQNEFLEDLENEDFEDEFSDKYGEYMSGGDLNLVQLYIIK